MAGEERKPIVVGDVAIFVGRDVGVVLAGGSDGRNRVPIRAEERAGVAAALLPPGTVAVAAERLARAVELLEAWDGIGGTIDWDAWDHHWDEEIDRLHLAELELERDDIAALRAALGAGDSGAEVARMAS